MSSWGTKTCKHKALPGVPPTDWQPYVLKHVPNEKVPVPCGLRVSVCLRGPGKLWIDELGMVPAGAGFGRAGKP